MPNHESLPEKIARLEQELAEMKRSLPAHSIRPHQILALEELEDELAAAQKDLEQAKG